MIELVVLNFMKTKLDVDVYMEEPEIKPDEYVLIEKTSSGRSNKLDSSTFAFQSYSQSLYGAAALNELTKSAADSLVELDAIASASLNSDYNFTDTTTKRYRYQAVYDIKHY